MLMQSRCLVHRLRHGRVDAWTTSFPRRVGYRSTSRDHQGLGYSDERSNPDHESKLHGAQISPDQASPLQQGRFPTLQPWSDLADKPKVFRKASPDAIDLISALLEYTPTQRLSAVEAMCQPFFDELRDPSTRLVDSRHTSSVPKELPTLFDFSAHGMHEVYWPTILLADKT